MEICLSSDNVEGPLEPGLGGQQGLSPGKKCRLSGAMIGGVLQVLP